MFISFEGIDGSGKSTQVRLLAEALEEEGYDVIRVREPGGTPLGESIRRILLDGSRDISNRTELLLFSAARTQLVEDVIRPALGDSAIVLADRFFDSTTAYQGGGRGIADQAWIRDFQMFVTGGLVPDLTFFLDVDPETAAGRLVQSETEGKPRVPDRMEEAGVSFFERVRSAYLDMAENEPDRFIVLHGDRKQDKLHREILQRVLQQRAKA